MNGHHSNPLSSVAYKAINEKEMISEEMRLIYVALTRAKEQFSKWC
jgi:ATP-dependent helicase/nuclease subunit A